VLFIILGIIGSSETNTSSNDKSSQSKIAPQQKAKSNKARKDKEDLKQVLPPSVALNSWALFFLNDLSRVLDTAVPSYNFGNQDKSIMKLSGKEFEDDVSILCNQVPFSKLPQGGEWFSQEIEYEQNGGTPTHISLHCHRSDSGTIEIFHVSASIDSSKWTKGATRAWKAPIYALRVPESTKKKIIDFVEMLDYYNFQTFQPVDRKFGNISVSLMPQLEQKYGYSGYLYMITHSNTVPNK
jgi:hypothetical protein